MNLAGILEGHPDDAVALIDAQDGVVTYGELRNRVAQLRAGLAEIGVERGDRVAIVLGNTPDFAYSLFAVLGLGAVAVACNPVSPEAELRRELESVAATVAIVGPDAASAFAGLGMGTVLTSGNAGVPGGRPLSEFGTESPEVPAVDTADDELAVLVFTSGTAGLPKAAMLSHGNLLSNLEQIQAHPGREVRADDVALGVLPLFHIFGLNVVLALTLKAGGTVVLREQFHPVSAAKDLANHGVTLVAGAPPMFGAWVALGGDSVPADSFSSVRLAVSGAAPLPHEVARGFEARFGLPLREGYGLTEASPVVTSSLLDRPAKPGSVGVPLPGIQVRLVDEEGEDALEGDPGEIWVKGPNVFAGYWEDSRATQAALTSTGWLRTGDVAVVDDSGELWLVDRAKDLIIVSGFNVYPAEVEAVLMDHPAVADAAVIGVPDPRTGEAVKAYVVVNPEAASQGDLMSHCLQHLARYKCPTQVELVSEVPHATSGKLLRRNLESPSG
jgi:long-chain acyl-CoA synthetase